jgi:hypothetical protein
MQIVRVKLPAALEAKLEESRTSGSQQGSPPEEKEGE